MKRRRMLGADDDSLRLLALQAHQISLTLDPYLPIRTLVEPRKLPSRPRARREGIRKLGDPEIARLVNERLAPAA